MNEMVHLINPDGILRAVMTREDFEDACSLGDAIRALLVPAMERMEESPGVGTGILTSVPITEPKPISLADLYRAYETYRPKPPSLIVQPKVGETARELGLAEGIHCSVTPYLPESIAAVWISPAIREGL